PALLLLVLVPIIGAAHAWHDVAKASLGVVGRYSCSAHQRARGAAQVMQRPVGYAGRPIEATLEIRESAERAVPAGGEHVPGASDARKLGERRPCRGRQRPD